MEIVHQILMKLKTSSNEGFLMKVFSYSLMWLSKHCSSHYATTQTCTLISWGYVHLPWCGSLEDYTLCHWNRQAPRLLLTVKTVVELVNLTCEWPNSQLDPFLVTSLCRLVVSHLVASYDVRHGRKSVASHCWNFHPMQTFAEWHR